MVRLPFHSAGKFIRCGTIRSEILQALQSRQCLGFRQPRNKSFYLPSRTRSHTTSSNLNSDSSRIKYSFHEDVESLERYGKGGYHPVHLGDELSKGRYKVVHKLGHGSYSTVWLCRDLQEQRYVSIKITISQIGDPEEPVSYERDVYSALRMHVSNHPGKRFVIPLLDDFTVEGPNGSHQCFVFPVAQDSVALAKGASTDDTSLFPAQVARSIAMQSLLALSYIHECGIIHAGILLSFHVTHRNPLTWLQDLHTRNVLIQAPSTAERPFSHPCEEPERLPVERYDGTPNGVEVPEYQIQAPGPGIPSDTVTSDCQIMVSDFGQAFFKASSDDQAQKAELCTPLVIRPLDTMLGHTVTSAVDTWTMGMTIFEILGNRNLIGIFWRTEDELITQAIETLGPLPSSMWQAWSNRSKYFNNDGSWVEEREPKDPKPFAVRLRDRMRNDTDPAKPVYSDAELMSLEKLLRSMLQYEPNNRITITEALHSEWARLYGLPALLESFPEIDLSAINGSRLQ